MSVQETQGGMDIAAWWAARHAFVEGPIDEAMQDLPVVTAAFLAEGVRTTNNHGVRSEGRKDGVHWIEWTTREVKDQFGVTCVRVKRREEYDLPDRGEEALRTRSVTIESGNWNADGVGGIDFEPWYTVTNADLTPTGLTPSGGSATVVRGGRRYALGSLKKIGNALDQQ